MLPQKLLSRRRSWSRSILTFDRPCTGPSGQRPLESRSLPDLSEAAEPPYPFEPSRLYPSRALSTYRQPLVELANPSRPAFTNTLDRLKRLFRREKDSTRRQGTRSRSGSAGSFGGSSTYSFLSGKPDSAGLGDEVDSHGSSTAPDGPERRYSSYGQRWFEPDDRPKHAGTTNKRRRIALSDEQVWRTWREWWRNRRGQREAQMSSRDQ